LDDRAWSESPYHDRAYALLSYHGGQKESEHGSFDSALMAELGSPKRPDWIDVSYVERQ